MEAQEKSKKDWFLRVILLFMTRCMGKCVPKYGSQ